MSTAIALIRGINVGGRNPLPMELLRALCDDAGFRGARTYIQSGNVVFRAGKRELSRADVLLEDAIEGARGFRPRVIVRTLDEWIRAIEAGPFAGRDGVEPGKLLVMFLDSDPPASAKNALAGVKREGEEIALIGREVHLYFPDGVGRSKLSMAAVEKAAGASGTARNWNTVNKLREMASGLGE